MISTLINLINSNIVLFDNTSLTFIYENICHAMINSCMSSEICEISGYQLLFYNQDLANNANLYLVTVGIDHYNIICEQYLNNTEFIQTSLADVRWWNVDQAIRDNLGTENLTVLLKFLY